MKSTLPVYPLKEELDYVTADRLKLRGVIAALEERVMTLTNASSSDPDGSTAPIFLEVSRLIEMQARATQT